MTAASQLQIEQAPPTTTEMAETHWSQVGGAFVGHRVTDTGIEPLPGQLATVTFEDQRFVLDAEASLIVRLD